MTFDDLPVGAAVFVDANTLVYHFIAEPKYGAACTTVLERIERQEIEGWTSPHLLAEVCHRLMTIEACQQFGWQYRGIAARLRRHPQSIAQLQAAERAMTELSRLGWHVATVIERHIFEALALGRQHGLPTNDALLVALMQSHGVMLLASADADFDRVPALTRYAPT